MGKDEADVEKLLGAIQSSSYETVSSYRWSRCYPTLEHASMVRNSLQGSIVGQKDNVQNGIGWSKYVKRRTYKAEEATAYGAIVPVLPIMILFPLFCKSSTIGPVLLGIESDTKYNNHHNTSSIWFVISFWFTNLVPCLYTDRTIYYRAYCSLY